MDDDEFDKWSEKTYFSESRDEKLETENLRLLFNNKSQIYVDIGASIGEYVFFANKHLTKGTLYAIEPDPRRFKLLAKKCEVWEKGRNNKIIPIQKVVSDRNSPVKFFTSHANTSGGIFLHDNLRTRSDIDEIYIESVTLDRLFVETKELPDLIKIDVEGSELSVLMGANEILSCGETIFLIELHGFSGPNGFIPSPPKDVLDLMGGYHYTWIPFFSHFLFFRKKIPWKFFVTHPRSLIYLFKRYYLEVVSSLHG